MNRFRRALRIRKIACGLLLFCMIGACQSWKPTALMSAGITNPSDEKAFRYWLVDASAVNYQTIDYVTITPIQVEESDTELVPNPDPLECFAFGQKDKRRRGVLIGCHAIELIDIRGKGIGGLGVLEQHQTCGTTALEKIENRYYVKNLSNFMYIDWASGAAYFIPEGYVSDAVSFPDWLRAIAPGPMFDVVHPKTLAASLIHDRYLCLANHSTRWAVDGGSTNNYRSRRAVNDTFRDVSLTTGSAAIFSQLARGAVGLANPQRGPAYVPTTHLTELIELESALDSDGLRELIRQADPNTSETNCLDVEPVFLCLTREKTLFAMLRSPSVTEELRSRGWYEAIAYLGCFSHRSEMMRRMTGISYSEGASDRLALCDISNPTSAISGFMPNIDMDDRMALRLGDVVIESAFLLNSEDGRNAFVELVGKSTSFDDVMPLIIQSRSNYVQMLTQSPQAAIP